MSETLGEGTTEKVAIIRSGYSSRILEIKRVPIPDPVPPLFKIKIRFLFLANRFVFPIARKGGKKVSSPERVSKLETLKAVAVLSLLANDIEDRVDEFSSLSVVTLGPIVSSSRLTENNVVGT